MTGPSIEFIVRSAGERTAEACTGLIAAQSGVAPTVVREIPFSRAVRRTMEIGRESGAEWVIAVDADVLVLGDFSDRIRGMCDRVPGDTFCATALVLCRIVGGLVFRGVHLYRASLMDEACTLLDATDPELRPETAVQLAMASRGYPKRYLAHAVGVHDYEQYLLHLYYKAMLRCRKDVDRDSIAASLRRRSPADTDAWVSLWGMEDAADEDDGPSEYDWRITPPAFQRRLSASGLTERACLGARACTGFAERTLCGHDYANDRVTARWIRERLDFDAGAPTIVNNLIPR